MKADAERRKREAGLMLLEACEQALGVRGPTALAALTGRSKSWWSKLTSGAAAFPTWEELEAVLPTELTASEREALHLRYRRAWLWRYDPELLEQLDLPAPVRCSMADLLALERSAGVLGYVQGDHRTALRLLKIGERLLVARGVDTLSREELHRLRACLDHQSVCESELGNHDAAIAVALRSVHYQRQRGDTLGDLEARHLIGLAQQKAGVHQQPSLLAKAEEQFERLQREYARLGMMHEFIRARRDGANTMVNMGLQDKGEAALIRTYEVPRQSGEDLFLTVMWLADAADRRGDVGQLRRWLAKLRVISRQHPEHASRLMSYEHVSRHVARLKRDATDPQTPRR